MFSSPITPARHETFFPTRKVGKLDIAVFGAGSAAAYLVENLAKMVQFPATIRVFDTEVVTPELARCSPYRRHQAERSLKRVVALANNVSDAIFLNGPGSAALISGSGQVDHRRSIIPRDQEIDEYSDLEFEPRVVFVLADNPDSRKKIVTFVADNCPFAEVLFDAWIGPNQGYLYTINPLASADVSFWESRWSATRIQATATSGVPFLGASMALAGRTLYQFLQWARGKYNGESVVLYPEVTLPFPCGVFEQVPDLANLNIAVFGAGALGSHLVDGLVRMVPSPVNVHVFDMDGIMPHNVPNQSYRHRQAVLSDDGQPLIPKVQALAENVAEAISLDAATAAALLRGEVGLDGSTTITAHNQRVDASTDLGFNPDIVFVMVDKMDSRKEIIHTLASRYPGALVMFEARLGTVSGRVYTVDPRDPESLAFWDSRWYPDRPEDPSVCRTDPTLPPAVLTLVGTVLNQFFGWARARTEPEPFALHDEIMLEFAGKG
jgi:hypothetical protein